MRAALALLLAAAAQAQVEVYLLDAAGQEAPAPALIDMGSVPAGDFADQRMRLRNTGDRAVVVQTLRIAGAGFSLQGNPSGQPQLAPGVNLDFRARFQPAAFGVYGATLQVNERSFVVRGLSPAGLLLSVETGEGPRPVTNGGLVDFGLVEVGVVKPLRFRLRNESAEPARLRQLRVTGSFEGPAGFEAPADIQPGGGSEFEVRFVSRRSGVFDGTLLVDDRVYRLQGTASDPPFPEADLLTGNAGSGQQATLVVRFREPSRTRGSVTLRMAFAPANGAPDDPGAMFLASSSRASDLAIAVGDISKSVTFQTGTTAGTISFRLEAGRQLQEASVAIPPVQIRVDQAKLSRSATGVEIELRGFDNTRSVREAAFTFHDREGKALTSEPVRVDVSGAFSRLFQESRMGGLFLLRASFPVAGDASLIGGAQVELVNSVGTARPERIGPP